MNRTLILILLILVSCQSSNTQSKDEAYGSFEGLIKFSTKITTTSSAPSDLEQKIKDKYGDSLIMYYSKTGDFRRVHLNSAEKNGTESQNYNANKGNIIFTNRAGEIIKNLDVKKNSLKILGTRKIDNLKIMGLDCECYEYKAVSRYSRNVTVNYCFSLNTPKINSKLFSKHEDFNLNEYYEIAKRPYLKFSLETNDYKLEYSATELIEKGVEKNVFEIN